MTPHLKTFLLVSASVLLAGGAPGQTHSFSLYVTHTYLERTFGYLLSKALKDQGAPYEVTTAQYAKQDAAHFSIHLTFRRKDDPSTGAVSAGLQIGIQNASTLLISATDPPTGGTENDRVTLRNQLGTFLNKRYDLSTLKIADNRYPYVDISAKVVLLNRGMALSSTAFDQYWTQDRENTLHAQYNLETNYAWYVLPVQSLNEMWPRQEDTIKYNDGNIILKNRAFLRGATSSGLNWSSDATYFAYRVRAGSAMVYGQNKYRSAIEWKNDLEVVDIKVEKIAGGDALEDAVVKKVYDDIRPRMRHQKVQPLGSVFYCQFTFGSFAQKTGFAFDRGFIADNNVFLNITIR